VEVVVLVTWALELDLEIMEHTLLVPVEEVEEQEIHFQLLLVAMVVLE